ncbi:helix-turn-helix transcriptional regulator [Nostocales cyanobacterium LEGE 11386]|nr:helix-turn-helix transcriptional regulator [Nostocales cyanobacterium LEGE 11386]
MGKAGKALKRVLEIYSISQNHLAVTMGTGRPNVHRWVNEIRDPVAETLLEIRDALKKINPSAAEDFIRLYLGDTSEDDENQP